MKLTTFVKQLKREYLAETKNSHQGPIYLCIMASRAAFTFVDRYYPTHDLIKSPSPYYAIKRQVKTQIKLRINSSATVKTYLASQKMDSSFAAQHKFRLALLEDLLDWAAEQDAAAKSETKSCDQ